MHGTYTLKNKDWVEDNRLFTQKEETFMQTYGYKQNMLKAAHPGYGTYQVYASIFVLLVWPGTYRLKSG